jgi:hypothetical protein
MYWSETWYSTHLTDVTTQHLADLPLFLLVRSAALFAFICRAFIVVVVVVVVVIVKVGFKLCIIVIIVPSSVLFVTL